MKITRRASLAGIAAIIVISAGGTETTPAVVSNERIVEVQYAQADAVNAPSDVKLTFDRIEVASIAAPVKVVEVVEQAPQPETVAVAAKTVPGNSVPAPVKAQLPPTAPQGKVVYVGLSGGQSTVDLGQGPVLFPLAGFPPYIAEHDSMGGWARFGNLGIGATVTMQGLVTGTYTVGQVITVPKGGDTTELSAFRTTPKVMLQTCIPGTNNMIVVGLY